MCTLLEKAYAWAPEYYVLSIVLWYLCVDACRIACGTFRRRVYNEQLPLLAALSTSPIAQYDDPYYGALRAPATYLYHVAEVE